METNVVNWFEVPVNDMNRAKTFYSQLLDKQFQDIPMPGAEIAAFPMIQDAPFSTGALVKADGYVPSKTGSLVYFSCEDVNDQLGKVEDLGGKIISQKTSIGEHGFVAHIEDSEGNHVALHSAK